jgi:adenine C2-methylase RlmN of 23S rRNA A2503 and tRNA A37
MELFIIVVIIIISILAFLALREFFCWYFKINDRLKKQDEIIELLKTVNKTGEKVRVPLNPVEKQVYSETEITKEMIEKLTDNKQG